MNIIMAFRLLGNNCKVCMFKIAQALEIVITQGSIDKCKACATVKAK